MENREINDIMTMSMEMLMMGLLCTILVMLTASSRSLYVAMEKQERNKEELTQISDEYFFEHGEHVLGADVISFILKYNAEYDYYFAFHDGTTYEITGRTVEELYDAGESFTYLWSQDYLTNTIFRDAVYRDFDVEKVEIDGGRCEYYITEGG